MYFFPPGYIGWRNRFKGSGDRLRRIGYTVTSRDVNFHYPDLVMQTDFVGFKNQLGKTHPKWSNFVLHPLLKTKLKMITNPFFPKSGRINFSDQLRKNIF